MQKKVARNFAYVVGSYAAGIVHWSTGIQSSGIMDLAGHALRWSICRLVWLIFVLWEFEISKRTIEIPDRYRLSFRIWIFPSSGRLSRRQLDHLRHQDTPHQNPVLRIIQRPYLPGDIIGTLAVLMNTQRSMDCHSTSDASFSRTTELCTDIKYHTCCCGVKLSQLRYWKATPIPPSTVTHAWKNAASLVAFNLADRFPILDK